MTALTHTQARQFILAAADGLLASSDQELLIEHLQTCAACQGYQAELNALEAQLQAACQKHRETTPSLQRTWVPNFQTQHRRNAMSARLASTLKFAIGSALLAGLVILVVTSMLNVKKIQGDPTHQPAQQTPVVEPQSTPTLETATHPEIDLSTGQQNGEWIAVITSIEQAQTDPNQMNVYLIHPDGSGAKKVTDFPAEYSSMKWSPDGKNLAFLWKQADLYNLMGFNPQDNSLKTLSSFQNSTDQPEKLFRWSPDGTKIAFADRRAKSYDIFTINADGSNLSQLTNDPGQETGFVWSPDGSQIAYESVEDLSSFNKLLIYTVDVHGGVPLELAHGAGFADLTWAQDGKSLYAATSWEKSWLECQTCFSNSAIYQLDLDGKSVRQIFHAKDSGGEAGISPELSNLYEVSSGVVNFRQFVLPSNHISWMQIDGKTPKTIGDLDVSQVCPSNPDSAPEEYVSPNPTFSLVIAPCAGKFDLYLASRQVASPEKFLTRLQAQPENFKDLWVNLPWPPITWSPDGRQALIQTKGASSDDTNIQLLNVDSALRSTTAQPGSMLSSKSPIFGISWQPAPSEKPQTSTPPNRLVAFELNQDGNSEIYVMKIDGTQLTNITNNPATDRNPIWSPDGKRIVFESNRNGNWDIYSMNVDGSGLLNLTNNPAKDELGGDWWNKPSPWSSNTRQLIFKSNRDGKAAWYVANTDNPRRVFKLNESEDIQAVWSPNGQEIAFRSNNSGISIIQSDGENKRALRKDETCASKILGWNKDNQSIYTECDQADGQWNVSQVNTLDTGISKTIMQLNFPPVVEYIWLSGDAALAYEVREDPPRKGLEFYRFENTQKILAGKEELSCDSIYHFATLSYHSTQIISATQCEGANTNVVVHNLKDGTSQTLGELESGSKSGSVYIEWSQDDQFVSITSLTEAGFKLYVIPSEDLHFSFGNLKPIFENKQGGENLPVIQPVDAQLPINLLQTKPTQVPEMSTQAVGRLAAFASTQDGNSEIYVTRTDGGQAVNLTNNAAYDGNPIWSPDGTRLAFESERDGNREVYIMNLDGSGVTRLTNNPANDVLTTAQAWSPDGKYLLYRNDRQGKWDLLAARTDGNGITQLTQGSDPAADNLFYWSPDGQKVAYEVDWTTKNKPQIYVINADGTNRQQLPTPKVAFSFNLYDWSADGKALYYNAFDCEPNASGDCAGPLTNLYRVALDSSAPVLLASTPKVQNWIIMPDKILYLDSNTPPMATNRNGSDQWNWWQAGNGDSKKLNEWANLQEKCQNKDIDSFYADLSNYAEWLETEKHKLVAIYCGKDNQSWFYLVNADGSRIQPLNNTAIPGRVDNLRVSADEQLALFDIFDASEKATYALDLITAQNDPTLIPVRLTGNDLRIQPVPFDSLPGPSPVPTPLASPTTQNLLSGSHQDLIAFARDSELFVMQKDGKALRQLTKGQLSYTYGPLWSPNRKQITFGGEDKNNNLGQYLINLDGNGLTRLSDAGWKTIWSPDGSQLATILGDVQNPADGKIEIVNADGSQQRIIQLANIIGEPDPGNPTMQWSSDGKYIQFLTVKFSGGIPYSSSDQWTIYQVNVQDGSLQTVAESKVPIAAWYGTATDLAYITADQDKNIWQWIHHQTVLATQNQDIFEPSFNCQWSPDHRQLVCTMREGYAKESFQLLLINADDFSIKSIAQGLTFTGNRIEPSWSPDGRYLVFHSSLESPGNNDIYRLDVQAALNDPATRPVRLTTSGFNETLPAWQP